MKCKETHIKGLFVLEPTVFEDQRGYFMESFQQDWFDTHIGPTRFIQDNESQSCRGVLRGLHLQTGSYAQAKLVRVLQGEVLDVAVDLRKNSPTFGQHFSLLLNDTNKKQLFIPRGFAHGFLVLSPTAVFSYKVDNVYSKTHESGIAYNDPELKIEWPLPASELLLSEKDKMLPTLEEWQSNPTNF